MDHKTSTSSTSYKFERKWSLINALAKELADIGDEINERYILDSLSYSEEIALIQTLSKSKPSRGYQHSHYVSCKVESTSKSEVIRLFYYATPVLVVAYLIYRRKS
ncbi:hypothetical protein MN116_006079 [Schistosoma mekongi]|uniref:Uncharacterized protein n=1 Tax=Schistosoma mekongi TaxID=38744 RepID=A0AAE1ZBM4_SCHME|nr:hypothetical protein MN116_006079 [Schistosoma mekongi]